MELIPGLPEELALECLTRLHYSTHRNAGGVCRIWRKLIHSKEFYYHRKRTGRTQKAACLVQSLPIQSPHCGTKSGSTLAYGISVFDPINGEWIRISSIPKYPHSLPLFCYATSSEGKLVLMGGWDPESYGPVKDVFVYEFTSQKWSKGKDMPDNRSFFAAGEKDGLIYVAGGHDESKNALNTAWVYDIRRDEWDELSRMNQDRDECEGVVIGSEFWVVSGYGTDNQGRFEKSAEVYQIGSSEWRRVEEAWKGTECPRSCVGVGKDGGLFTWSEFDSAIRVGLTVINLDNFTLLSGSDYQGGEPGLFMVGGQNGKLRRIETPSEFSGYVQSGCSVEI